MDGAGLRVAVFLHAQLALRPIELVLVGVSEAAILLIFKAIRPKERQSWRNCRSKDSAFLLLPQIAGRVSCPDRPHFHCCSTLIVPCASSWQGALQDGEFLLLPQSVE